MSIVFTYLAFTLHQLDKHTLYLSMDDEDVSAYQLYFQYELECANFQKVLYELADGMEDNGIESIQQIDIVGRFIESNPLYYEYEFVCSRMSS